MSHICESTATMIGVIPILSYALLPIVLVSGLKLSQSQDKSFIYMANIFATDPTVTVTIILIDLHNS